MGGLVMINQVRFGRQSAVRIFAQEYSDANLPLEGVGEYAPSFIITKLGAKVNRALFGGVIDRFERREGDNGPTYSGHLRDATGGVHRAACTDELPAWPPRCSGGRRRPASPSGSEHPAFA